MNEACPHDGILQNGNVHVWSVPLGASVERISTLRRYLTADERARARRFLFERDQHLFIAARGMLRVLLGYYLQRDPARLEFRYGPWGKPEVTRESGGDAIQFNLSHSGNLGLVAVTRDRPIGVDLELIRPDPATEQVARRFFSPDEVTALTALPPSVQREAFFRCWTRKEAYLKARGNGLSLPLDHFSVSLTPGEPAAVLTVRGDPDEASRWTIHSLSPGPGYVGALAVKGAIRHCVFRSLEW